MIGKKLIARVILMLFIILASALLIEGNAIAQTPQFRLDMDSLNLQKGLSTNLIVSMVNAQEAEVIEISGLEDFDVISSSNSTATQIINGDATYEQDVNYIIMPKNVGEFTLQGNVKYNGKTYQTNQLQINVSEADDTEKGEAEDLFIKTLLSNSEIYFGHKVVLAYELFSRYNIRDFGFLDPINIKDFIGNDIPVDNLKANITYLNGNKYVEYKAKQTILSPIKTGTFTLPEYRFQVNVSTGNFFNSSKAVYLQTDSKELTVKPLPLENQPENFSGIVGKLNLESKYSKQEIDYGDSLTLQVTASGNCNLDSLKEIVKENIPGFSVYQTEKNAEERIEDNQYYVKKVFEVILVPKENGEIKIDPINIAYFDPETGSYEQAEIPGTTITVKGEMPQAQPVIKNEMPNVEKVKIEQVNYQPAKEGYLTIQVKKEYLLIGIIVIVILLTLSALVIWIFSFRRKNDKKLHGLYKQINHSDNQNEIYDLFNSMIKHCFNISLKASPRSKVSERLTSTEFVNSTLEIVDYMENGRYHTDKGPLYLKMKVKEIYKGLKRQKVF